MQIPSYQELEPKLKQILNPEKPKLLEMLAKGAAPVPPPLLVASWVYFVEGSDTNLQNISRNSLSEFPKSNLKNIIGGDIPAWALFFLGKFFKDDEEILENILLNERCSVELFVFCARDCSERICNLIANNQEKIIEAPEIVFELEKNPNNLQSTTDRLRQFLKLAGIFVPASQQEVVEQKALEVEHAQLQENGEPVVHPDDEISLEEEQRMTLTKLIGTLNTGAKVKLALKGNKEARNILIKDANKTVATSVLKSPRMTEPEVVHYSALKNVADDVIRIISRNPGWTKNYNIKLNLIGHPKTPLQTALQFVKFLNLRDLQSVSRSKTIPGPVRKAAKELLSVKRK